jgi:hypothetical protein
MKAYHERNGKREGPINLIRSVSNTAVVSCAGRPSIIFDFQILAF